MKTKKIIRAESNAGVSLHGGKHITGTITLWYWLAFIVDQNWKNKIYRLGKVDERIPKLPLT